jgi:hypothetical protein
MDSCHLITDPTDTVKNLLQPFLTRPNRLKYRLSNLHKEGFYPCHDTFFR